MKLTCANCGKSLEYAIARNFEGRVECLGCGALVWVVAVRGEVEETRIYRGTEVAKPKDITIAEHDIDKSWKEWRVDSFINLEGFQRLVKRTYLQLVERAKKRKTIFYRELEGFDELKSTFRDGVARVIAFVVGASSEAELQNGQPPISAILVEKDTGNRGHGCYGLPVVPQNTNYDAWEGKGVHGEAIPIDIQAKRLEFWEQEIKEVHAFWGDKG